MPSLPRALEAVRRDPARACLIALVLADLLLIALLPVLVGQDLPQHLSYARILADHADPRLPFDATFTVPTRPQPYFTAYLFLAPIARITSVLTACRILYGLYVVAMAVSFAALVRAVHEPKARTPWTVVLGAVLPWNPVQLVGFLPFMLSLPAMVWSMGAILRVAKGATRRACLELAAATAVAMSLHMVAGAVVVVLATVHALIRRSRPGGLAAFVTVAAALVTLVAWHTMGERGLAELPIEDIVANVRRAGLWDGLVQGFGVQWNASDVKWTFVLATVLGPLVRSAKATVGVGIVVLTIVALSGRSIVGTPSATPSTSTSRRPFVWTVIAFALLVTMTPASIRVPDDICLLDFRLYVVAFILAVACVDPKWLEPVRARVAVTAFAALVLSVWSCQLGGAANEAMQVVRLTGDLSPSDTLLALPFHDRSEYLDEDNSVTHYFPVYFTALHGGVTSSFWGKFSHHLPVGFRPGRELPRPPDWDTARFTREELLASTQLLVEWPDADDDDRRVTAAERLKVELADGFTPGRCEGRWCLFASPRGPTDLRAPEEARR